MYFIKDTKSSSLHITAVGDPVRMDRQVLEKKAGGGVCISVNDRHCNSYTLSYCCEDTDVLSLSFRPIYGDWKLFYSLFIFIREQILGLQQR